MSVTYTADGTQTVFSFPFDYLRKAFVFVEVNEETVLTQGTDYSVSNKTVVFTTAPIAGTVLRIYRQTDTKPLVSWADASVLRAKDMTVQQIQELHILEETQEWARDYAIIRNGSEWNARNFPIKNVGDPEDDKDATNKEYVDNLFTEVVSNGGKIFTYDTITALRSASLVPDVYALTSGYYEHNDGGCGFYYIRTKTQSDVDDGGSIIVLNNGNIAELITDKMVNVKQFGAKGDGVTDDTNAIRNAINSRVANEIFFPRGSYLVTSNSVGTDEGASFVLTERHNHYRFIGAGSDITAIVPKSNKVNVFCVINGRYLTFKDLAFDNSINGALQNQAKPHSRTPNTGVVGNGNCANAAIDVFKGVGLTVENCAFKSWTLGIQFTTDYEDLTQADGQVTSVNNNFDNCCFCHLIDTVRSLVIDGCVSRFTKNSINADSTDPGHMLYLTNRSSAYPQSVLVTNILDKYGQNSAVKVRKGDNVIVDNVEVYQSAKGVELWTVKNGKVSNCSIILADYSNIDAVQAGIEICDCGNVLVEGNVVNISNVSAWGVRVRPDLNSESWHNNGLTIVGNHIVSQNININDKSQLILVGQTNYIIEGNTFIDYSSSNTIRQLIDIRSSSYGYITKNICRIITAQINNILTLDSSSSNNTVLYRATDTIPNIDSYVGNSGSNNNIINEYVGNSYALAPNIATEIKMPGRLAFIVVKRGSTNGIYLIDYYTAGFATISSAGIVPTIIHEANTNTFTITNNAGIGLQMNVISLV